MCGTLIRKFKCTEERRVLLRALLAVLHLVPLSCAFLFLRLTFKHLTDFLLLAAIFQLSRTGSPFCWLPERNLTIGKLLCKSCQFLTVDSRSAVPCMRCLITWWLFCGTLPSEFTRGSLTFLATDAGRDGGPTLASMHWLLATQRGETFEGLICPKTALSSPPVGFTSTFWSARPTADSGDLGKTMSPVCAPRTPRLAPVVSADAFDCQTVDAHPMLQCCGVQHLSALGEHVTTGGRTFRRSLRLEDTTSSFDQ